MKLESLSAIITGGASGLGAATARLFAARGAKVALFDRNIEAGKCLAEEIGGAFFHVDVTSDQGVAKAIAQAEAVQGVARLLVCCAGVSKSSRIVGSNGEPHDLEVFRRTVETNLVGTFNVLSKFAARLVSVEPIGEERGVIVNTASVTAFDGQAGQAAYSASKMGIVGMTLPIARDLSSYYIRVAAIAPGIFLTPMLQALPQERQDSLGGEVPFPSRLGRPEEFAHLVASIIANPMLNGEVIRLDGAIRLPPS